MVSLLDMQNRKIVKPILKYIKRKKSNRLSNVITASIDSHDSFVLSIPKDKLKDVGIVDTDPLTSTYVVLSEFANHPRVFGIEKYTGQYGAKLKLMSKNGRIRLQTTRLDMIPQEIRNDLRAIRVLSSTNVGSKKKCAISLDYQLHPSYKAITFELPNRNS